MVGFSSKTSMQRNVRFSCLWITPKNYDNIWACECFSSGAQVVSEAKDAGAQAANDAAQKAGEVKDAVQEKAEQAKEAGAQVVEAAAQKADEAKSTIVETAIQAKDAAVEKAQELGHVVSIGFNCS